MGDVINGLGSRSGLLALATAALALHAAHSVAGIGQGQLDLILGELLYSGLVLAAAAACLYRASHADGKSDRPSWLALGVAFMAWGLGSALDTSSGRAPFPGYGDALALLFYPAVCVAMALYTRERVGKLRGSLALDAGIGALCAAGIGAALGFNASPELAAPAFDARLTQVAYAAGDLIVVAAVVAAFALTGWRPERSWLLVGAGVVAAALGDVGYAHHAPVGFQSADGAIMSVWPAAAVIVCYGAFEPHDPSHRLREKQWRPLVMPMAFAGVAALTLVYNELHPVGLLSFGFALVALLGVTVRPAFGFRENVRILKRSEHEAQTDALTGLGNRRRLMTDLRAQVKGAHPSAARILILFDLDGFKQYNDTFGHPAGDALLSRLGANLQKAVGPYGGVYRMGGDEFCVLLKVGMESARTLASIAAAALSERGEGFNVRASYGAVMIPQEAREPALALKIADQRMYAQKEKRRPSTGRQTRDILLQALRERDPELSDHMSAVGELSRRVGQRLRLLPEELDETVRAAELHDIGKMAIPDAILHKPGPLDESEWEFVHKHTVIGERILSAAPALVPVAKVVRASHERWDGKGYPDGLTGDAIPVGARIVAACDAYHAMTSARPYGTTLSPEEGMEELRKGAGAEFAPRVVEALCDVVREANPPGRKRPGAPPKPKRRAQLGRPPSVI